MWSLLILFCILLLLRFLHSVLNSPVSLPRLPSLTLLCVQIEARHIMRSGEEWDRFMRFMERYAEEMGLGFSKAK
jgi:hypothetical protein